MVKERTFKLAIKSLNDNPRYWAARIVTQVLQGQGYSNFLLNQCLSRQLLKPVDQDLLVQLVYGTLQHKLTLDYYLQPLIKKPQNLAPLILNLLRISVYQLYYLDRIPDRAIFYEATQIAKKVENPGAGKLVTAVLRNLQRQGQKPVQTADPKNQLSIEYSVPLWVIEKLTAQIGWAKTQTLVHSLNQPPKNAVRVNLQKTNLPDLQQQLATQNISTQPSVLSPVGLVSQQGAITQSSLLQQGLYTVQDESAMLVAPALQVGPQHRILDACAAPGGKTTQLASYLEPGGQITALDLHATKLRLIEANARRLGVQNYIQTQALDARQADQHLPAQSYDRILVDAPCSGFGLMRRKPEIRYLRDAKALTSLAQVQQDILTSVAPLLKVGGLLVYSTCTIFEEENQQIVHNFLTTHREFTLAPVVTTWPLKVLHRGDFVQIFPDDFQTDGFFIACLKKTR